MGILYTKNSFCQAIFILIFTGVFGKEKDLRVGLAGLCAESGLIGEPTHADGLRTRQQPCKRQGL